MANTTKIAWSIVTTLNVLEELVDMSPAEYAINTPKNARKINLTTKEGAKDAVEATEPTEPTDANPLK